MITSFLVDRIILSVHKWHDLVTLLKILSKRGDGSVLLSVCILRSAHGVLGASHYILVVCLAVPRIHLRLHVHHEQSGHFLSSFIWRVPYIFAAAHVVELQHLLLCTSSFLIQRKISLGDFLHYPVHPYCGIDVSLNAED